MRPRRVWGPLSRHNFHSFFPLLVSSRGILVVVSSRGILVVFRSAGTLKCARLEFSGCRVKPRRPQSRTFQGPDLPKHHQKSTRRQPERDKWSGRGEKKSEILGGPGVLRRPVRWWGGLAEGGPAEWRTKTHKT